MGAGLYQKLAFWNQSKERVSVGVFVKKNTLWVTISNNQHEPQQLSIDFDGNWESACSQLSEQCPNAALTIVLNSELYQLVQADKPNVDTTELKAALLWSVKDLVNIPPANIHLDYFDSPTTANGKLNVVIVDRNIVQELALAADKFDLVIDSVSIEELQLTKLPTANEQAQLVLCHHEGGELLLAVVKNSAIYLQRRIRGFHALDKMTREDLSYGAVDNLSIEIQRSMDFYEGQLRQPPIKQITLLIDKVAEDLAELLNTNFDQAVIALKTDNVSGYLSGLSLKEHSEVV